MKQINFNNQKTSLLALVFSEFLGKHSDQRNQIVLPL
jgi:hypothetical protein